MTAPGYYKSDSFQITSRSTISSARLRVQIKYTFRNRSAECDVPKYVLQAIVDDMMPNIRAFFESEEGKREFEKWKIDRVNNLNKVSCESSENNNNKQSEV